MGRAIFLVALLTLTLASSGNLPAEPGGLYDDSPDHLWNRLHRALFLRMEKDGTEFGLDDTVPFQPQQSMDYLDSAQAQTAVTLLDEFLSGHGEGLVQDPLKRALFQHDLWAAFDNCVLLSRWLGKDLSYNGPGRTTGRRLRQVTALRPRLAACLQRLALSVGQIKALPDNFALALKSGAFAAEQDPMHPEIAFLPPDLFDAKGPWVQIEQRPEAASDETTAPVHVQACSGQSVFEVYMRQPGGRAATLAYLQKLNLFATPWKLQPDNLRHWLPPSDTGPFRDSPVEFAPDTPQFPAGTAVALVRRMVLISDQLLPVVSPLIESVQMRVYRQVAGPQDVYELMLRRADLLAGKAGGLHAVGLNDREPNLLVMGTRYGNLSSCRACHSGNGILSVQSYVRRFSEASLNPTLTPALNPGDSAENLIEWKQHQYDWGLLIGQLGQK